MWSPVLSLALALHSGLDLPASAPDAFRTAFAHFELDGLESAESTLLELFDDVRIEGVRDGVVPFGPGRFVWVGHVRGEESSSIVLSISTGVLVGTVRAASGQYRIRPAGAGFYRVEEVSLAGEPPERAPLVPFVDRALARSKAMADDGSSLDLLLAYTPRARAGAGGEPAIEALVQLGIAETNWALENSGVATRLRLVHLLEVPYRESGRAESDLEILKLENDGALDELHRLRDEFGADFVQLVVEEHDGCGISYSLSDEGPGFAEWAFSVVERGCIDTSYAVAHELGHNFGCDHAPEDPATRGAFIYSFGYKDFLAGFRTIMAYGPGRRIARFSSPRIAFEGVPAGAPGQDNARTIQELRSTLARFRPSIQPPRLSYSSIPGKDGTLVRLSPPTTGVSEWRLLVGTSAGAGDVFDSGSLAENEALQIPANVVDAGARFARLWYRRARVWLYEDSRLDSSR